MIRVPRGIDPDDVPDAQDLDDLHRWVMRGARTLSAAGATIADAPQEREPRPQ